MAFDIKNININETKEKILTYLSSIRPAKKKETTEVIRTVGLNIGKANIVGSEILHQNNQVTLERVVSRPRTTQSLKDQIKLFFEDAKFQSKQVNVSLKGQGVVVRFLNFPRMSRSEFESSIQFEAEKYLPFNLSEVMLDFHINETATSKGKGGAMPVILVAARKNEVNKLIDVIQSAGAKIQAIDIDIFACANAFAHANVEAQDQNLGLVDFGARDTTFMIWDKGTLAFSRDIAFGGLDAMNMIKRKLNVDDNTAFQMLCNPASQNASQMAAIQESLDRLFHELKLSLNYYCNQRQDPPDLQTIYISGGLSQMEMLPEALETFIGIPVKTWDPTHALPIAESCDQAELKKSLPLLAVSIGLALRKQ